MTRIIRHAWAGPGAGTRDHLLQRYADNVMQTLYLEGWPPGEEGGYHAVARPERPTKDKLDHLRKLADAGQPLFD